MTTTDTLGTLDSKELLGELDELTLEIGRLAAQRLSRLREVDTRGLAELDGYRSTPAWLSFRYRTSRRTAGADMRLARQLASMSHTAAALETGAISLDHARRLARARTSRTESQFGLNEQALVANAAEMSFYEFENIIRYWEQHADPDGAEQAEQRAIQDRNLSLTRLNDEWVIRGTSDLASGTEISEALHRIEQELFDTDWAEAKQRVGNDVCLSDLARTNAQRRHDSFLEMARRATATGANCRQPEPLLTIVMDYETFIEQGLLHARRHLRHPADRSSQRHPKICSGRSDMRPSTSTGLLLRNVDSWSTAPHLWVTPSQRRD